MKLIRFLAAGCVASIGLDGAPPAGAQQARDPAFDRGQILYESHCAACHQPSGEGVPPNFPALDGNRKLADHAFIVAQVRGGKGAMPAFPDLSAEEIADVATYIRTAWSNDFGPVGTAEAEEVLATVQVRTAERSIWDGVYTSSQASEARIYYLGTCAACHGSRLNGAPDEADMAPGPPLTGPAFMRNWGGRTLAALFEYTRTTMPIRNPGQLSDQEYADVIAYMLSYAGAPAGGEKLQPDIGELSNILIEAEPGPD